MVPHLLICITLMISDVEVLLTYLLEEDTTF